jgi:hypothetical protein
VTLGTNRRCLSSLRRADRQIPSPTCARHHAYQPKLGLVGVGVPEDPDTFSRDESPHGGSIPAMSTAGDRRAQDNVAAG